MNATDVEITESQLYALMLAYLEHRRTAKQAERAMEIAAKPVRDFLDREGGELWDGERKIKAWLQARKGPDECDLMTMAKDEPNLVMWLAEHGLLKVDWKAVAGLDGKAREMLRLKDFTSPGPGSQALKIERTE